MRLSSLILTLAGFWSYSHAIFTCRAPDEVHISEDDPSYFHKCLAAGVSIQLKCPPGQYFSETSGRCATGLTPREPGKSQEQIPTAPTAVPTARTENSVARDTPKIPTPATPPNKPVPVTKAPPKTSVTKAKPRTKRPAQKATKPTKRTTPAARKPNVKTPVPRNPNQKVTKKPNQKKLDPKKPKI